VATTPPEREWSLRARAEQLVQTHEPLDYESVGDFAAAVAAAFAREALDQAVAICHGFYRCRCAQELQGDHHYRDCPAPEFGKLAEAVSALKDS